ncbi:ABC transporter transmembrane domain-containing protein [Streptomyces sp. NRRL S-337]|uniref:ABC transporter transmembrane domain-containing protein n=1 Tax=Streptomyces sp. NRRL S-337 TaxID=1463900 RepID=UPI001F3D1BF5|nr:ABC transporter ATP-binding protein [Streptomyces sp. NRRL S-337]
MQIRDLPHPDPGVPDVRTGGSFLRWLYKQQLGGQLKALAWGLVNFGAIASFPLPVGMAVQAAVDRDGGRLALSGGLILVLGALIALGGTMLHRAAVTNWITAVARMQQLLARKTTELGSAMTRQVAAGEIVAVSTGDLEKIGWFVETISRFGAAAVTAVAVAAALVVREPHLGILVALGVPVLALAVLPLLPPAARRADAQREMAGRATELASDTVAGLRVLRGIGGEELFLGRYRAASQEVRRAAVRSARMWSLIAAVQVALPGLLLIAVVWYGTRLALDGTVAVGELVMIYSAVTFLLLPLRHFEEIAQALSFARPSARRTARVLAQHRPAGGRDGDNRALPSGDLHDPVSGLTAPAGRLTAVVCGDPDTAGRLAERLGGHTYGGGAAAAGQVAGVGEVARAGQSADRVACGGRAVSAGRGARVAEASPADQVTSEAQAVPAGRPDPAGYAEGANRANHAPHAAPAGHANWAVPADRADGTAPAQGDGPYSVCAGDGAEAGDGANDGDGGRGGNGGRGGDGARCGEVDGDGAHRGAGGEGGTHCGTGGGAGQGLPSVTLGGIPLDDLPRDAARKVVLVQDKDPMLLSGTLGELLDVPSSGRLAADEALTAAQCADVLTALAQASLDDSGDPMRTHITERGRSLSGGQRQRLALARSLVTDPEVLVLDEPTSAVDAHTEARIADGLREVRTGRTTVVLTSSPLLLDRADQVAFLHEGKVVAEAPHHELLHSHPAYRSVVTRETEPEGIGEAESEATRETKPNAVRETEPEAVRETESEAVREAESEDAPAPESDVTPHTGLAPEGTRDKNPERVLTTAQVDETA